jgi:hypothetical protein
VQPATSSKKITVCCCRNPVVAAGGAFPSFAVGAQRRQNRVLRKNATALFSMYFVLFRQLCRERIEICNLIIGIMEILIRILKRTCAKSNVTATNRNGSRRQCRQNIRSPSGKGETEKLIFKRQNFIIKLSNY